MKSKFAKTALYTVLGLALVAGIAFAEQEGGAGMHHGMRGMHRFGGDPGMAMMLHRLNLTEDQKAQVKKIFEAEKPTMQPLHQQEFQAHQQMMQLITSGNFDQAKATAIATQEAQTHIQMEVEHAKIHAQIYQLLDSTQKAKVADMMAKHQERMQQHMQKQGGEDQPAPPAQ
ncbi:MAG TPA: Spy/CpxP family protein refolding chaperone [Terriglobales bacterium]|nr:Spy/CpxP family protein refolding chaperone [Terriglobales bacterium]